MKGERKMRNLIRVIIAMCVVFSSTFAQIRISPVDYLKSLEKQMKGAKNDSLFSYYNDLLYKNASPLLNSSYFASASHYLAIYYNNAGGIQSDRGKYKEAYNSYFKALTLSESIADSSLIGETYNNIATMFYYQKYYNKSIQNHIKAIRVSRNFPENLSTSYTSLSADYFSENMVDSAIHYANKAIEIYNQMGDSSSIAISLCNIGSIQNHTKDYKGALVSFTKAFDIYKNINPSGSVMMLSNVARIYTNLGDMKHAEEAALKLKEFSVKNNSPAGVMEAALILKKVYQGQNKCKLEMKETMLFYTLKDSIQNESNKNDLVKRDLQYSFDKKSLTDSLKYEAGKKIQDAKLLAQENKLQKEKIQRYAISIGLLLVIIFAALMVNRFLLIRKQKEVIADQKKLVDEKQAETLASIRYAQILQDAILPSQDQMHQELKNCSIFYNPKDIVAGDFYWYQNINGYKFIAAADCTGHGVPGAMVSVVCSTALNRAVTEFGLTDPGQILDLTNELVKKTFSKNKEVKDGMDISLLAINEDKKSVKWAGANNPLWVLYPKTSEITEYKGNKQPVGNHFQTNPFTTLAIPYIEDTKFHLITDGFADQFGGPDNKKFKANRLQALFVGLKYTPPSDTIKLLYKEFVDYKGDNEQTDDVTLISFEI